MTVAFSRAGDLFASGGADAQVWLSENVANAARACTVWRRASKDRLKCPKVLMWKTNFDSRNYRDVLLQHSRRTTPHPPPHPGDFPPRLPHLHHPAASDIQVGNPNLTSRLLAEVGRVLDASQTFCLPPLDRSAPRWPTRWPRIRRSSKWASRLTAPR